MSDLSVASMVTLISAFEGSEETRPDAVAKFQHFLGFPLVELQYSS